MKDKLIKLKEELLTFPNPPNEIDVANYCLRIIDKSMRLSGYEKTSFSNHLSKIMIQERIKGIEETKQYFLKIIDSFQKELQLILEDKVFLTEEYRFKLIEKLEELKRGWYKSK